ncbi:MAG: hypothetical protein PQJ61_15610 [Spirochaetales bacterium]|uniref:Uncharacterized protein n=1 Tax=Candidatus Thalassospirochaeta sargassi TaxID=3119039 RepID=A0AAJ1IHS7_9SPIO|nr:hypothetical protein [Spirochaetales bacterium]
MKKCVLLIWIIIFFTIGLYAEDVVWGSMYDQGNFRLGVEAAIENTLTDTQLAVYPEAEMLLWKPLIANTAFIDIGAAVEGRLGIPVTAGSGLSTGAGILGTIHLGFRGFEFTGSEYLSKIDVYAEAGLKYDFITDDTRMGGVVKTGINYYLTEKTAVGAFYSNWGGFYGAGLAFSIKLGRTPAVKGISFELPEISAEPYLMQFYTLFYASAVGGWYYPDSYAEGQASVHRISVMDSSGADSYTVERAFLKALEDGHSLWRFRYSDDDDSFYYEFITDEDHNIITVYYDSEDEGLVEMKAGKYEYPEEGYAAWDDSGADSTEGVEVRVEAGKFMTTEYSWIDESGTAVFWWASDEVPGKLVSYKMEDDSDIVISELIDISSGNRAILHY